MGNGDELDFDPDELRERYRREPTVPTNTGRPATISLASSRSIR